MLRKQTTYLKVFLLMITVFFAISANVLAASISNVTGLKANITNDNVFLSWTSVDGADGYDVYFYIPGQGYMNLGSVPANGAKVSGFSSGYTYKTKIKAYKYVNGQKITSANYSNEVSIKIGTTQNENKPAKANNLKATIYTDKVKLTWDKAENASGYDVYFNIPGQGYTNIGSINNNSAYVSGFIPGYTYYARILSYKEVNGKKVYADNYSNEVTVKIKNTTTTVKPTTPTNLTAYLNNNVVALDWKESTNATGYDVYLYTPGTGYKKIASTENNFYDILTSTLRTGTTYRVKVKAYNNSNGTTTYSEYSQEASFKIEDTTVKPTTPTNLTVDIHDGLVSLDWNKSSNTTGYDIYLYTPGTGYKKLASTVNNFYDIQANTLQEEKTYRVKVRAYNNDNGKTTYSTYSKEAPFKINKTVVNPTVPTNLTADVHDGLVSLNWNKSSNTTGYEVYLYTSSTGYKKLASTVNNFYDIQANTLQEGKTYRVKVRAYNNNNGKTTYSEYSKETTFKIEKNVVKPSKVTNLTAYVNSKGNCVALDWNKATGNVSGYEVYLYTPGIGYKCIYSTERNYYDIPFYTLKSGTTYRVKVRAYTSDVGVRTYADFSDEVTFTYTK